MAERTAETPACVHLWKIAPAAGPTSLGRCSHCGAIREFENSVYQGNGLFNLSPRERLARRRGS